MERIRLDRTRAPQRLKSLLAYIEEHLFDPTLDVNQLKRSCGVRDNSVPIQFHSAVGRPPHGYIEDRRLETACRLLGKTDLKIWQISELLGYSSIQVFSRAFSRWSGQRPTLYRKKARRGEGGQEPQTRAPGGFFDAVTLRRALAGELPNKEASQMVDRLVQLYPASGRGAKASGAEPAAVDGSSDEDDPGSLQRAGTLPDGSVPPPADVPEEALLASGEIEKLEAAEKVTELEKHPVEKRLEIVGELELTSPELVHALVDRSRDIANENPPLAVELAELALKSLEVLERSEPDAKSIANLRVAGWIHLADIRRYGSDERGAEQALAQAERFHHSAGEELATEAEIVRHKAILRRDQRRFEEAAVLFGRALEIGRELDREEQIGELSVMLAEVYNELGNAAAATPHLLEALGRRDDGPGKLALYDSLLSAYIETEKHTEASELLPQAQQAAVDHGEDYHHIRFRWIEGVLLRDLGRFAESERVLLEARDEFSEIDDAISAALVCLDVADLYCRQSRTADLEKLGASLVSLFGSLQHHREALVALRLLHQAAEERRVSQVMLHNARIALESSQHLRAPRR
ncbi:MAG: AraC family transcriptional regulator [Thermoanaerobaculia bacterium]